MENFFERTRKWSGSLQDAIAHKSPTEPKLVHLITCMQLSKEVTEVLDCVPWKFERECPGKSREELLEEMVDVYNFFLKLMWCHEISPDEFMDAWENKKTIIERRLLP